MKKYRWPNVLRVSSVAAGSALLIGENIAKIPSTEGVMTRPVKSDAKTDYEPKTIPMRARTRGGQVRATVEGRTSLDAPTKFRLWTASSNTVSLF